MVDVLNRAAVAQMIEATKLGPGVKADDVRGLVDDAVALGVGGICVPPGYVGLARRLLDEKNASLDLVTVANFPFGDSSVEAVEAEVRTAVTMGADHVDVVAPIGMILSENWGGVDAFFIRIVQAVRDVEDKRRKVQIKIILETATLGSEAIWMASGLAVHSGVDWLKTSTGFHPAGGATEHAVHTLRRSAPPFVRIKASGGIRTWRDVERMVSAGADRVGTSAYRDILDAFEARTR